MSRILALQAIDQTLNTVSGIIASWIAWRNDETDTHVKRKIDAAILELKKHKKDLQKKRADLLGATTFE